MSINAVTAWAFNNKSSKKKGKRMSFYSAGESIKTTFWNYIEQILIHLSIISLQRIQWRLMLPTKGFLHHQSPLLGHTTGQIRGREVEAWVKWGLRKSHMWPSPPLIISSFLPSDHLYALISSSLFRSLLAHARLGIECHPWWTGGGSSKKLLANRRRKWII